MGNHTTGGLPVALAALVSGWGTSPLQCCSAEPVQKIDLNGSHVEIIDDVAVPIAHEVFASLDKLGPRSWSNQLIQEDVPSRGSRSEVALRFGFVIANGFISVASESQEAVERTGRDVLKLARALNLEKPVITHAQAIIESARARDWEAARTELDIARETVRSEMQVLRDHDVAELVSLGGWICGTHAVAGSLSENYSREGAELLSQPGLVRRLSDNLDLISGEKKKAPVFSEVTAGLAEIGSLTESTEIPPATVAEIRALTNKLAAAILTSKKP